VRLVPGSGQFHLDGRSLEDYFPNKVHQQLIKAPLVTVDRADSFDIHAHLDGGGPSGQAGALRLEVSGKRGISAFRFRKITPDEKYTQISSNSVQCDCRKLVRIKYVWICERFFYGSCKRHYRVFWGKR